MLKRASFIRLLSASALIVIVLAGCSAAPITPTPLPTLSFTPSITPGGPTPTLPPAVAAENTLVAAQTFSALTAIPTWTRAAIEASTAAYVASATAYQAQIDAFVATATAAQWTKTPTPAAVPRHADLGSSSTPALSSALMSTVTSAPRSVSTPASAPTLPPELAAQATVFAEATARALIAAPTWTQAAQQTAEAVRAAAATAYQATLEANLTAVVQTLVATVGAEIASNTPSMATSTESSFSIVDTLASSALISIVVYMIILAVFPDERKKSISYHFLVLILYVCVGTISIAAFTYFIKAIS